MLNLSEAAKESGQSKSAVWRAVNSGRLPAARTFAGDSFTAYFLLELSWRRTFPPSYR